MSYLIVEELTLFIPHDTIVLMLRLWIVAIWVVWLDWCGEELTCMFLEGEKFRGWLFFCLSVCPIET
jgi:hypothetical protein